MRAKGIDISHHNGKFIDPGNIDFIFTRTSNGTKEDREYKNNLPEVKKVDRRGVYHYYRTNHAEHPMEEQADLILRLITGVGMRMIATDYEISDYDDNVLDRTTAIELYGFLLYLIQERPDIRQLLYTGIYTWRDVLLPLQGVDTKYGVIDWGIVSVWIPRYAHTTDEYILKIYGIQVLPDYSVWQKSKTGVGKDYGVESTYVDLNVFNGTVQELDEWLGIEDKPVGDCHKTPCATLQSVLQATEAGFIEGDKIIQQNTEDIKTVNKKITINTYEIKSLEDGCKRNYEHIDKLNERLSVMTNISEAHIGLIEINSKNIDELEAKQKEDGKDIGFLQGQYEYHEVRTGQFNRRLTKLETKTIPETNHSHFWHKWEWFKKLTGYYNQRS